MSGAKEKKKIGLTTQIFIALIVGAILGIVLHVAASDVEFVQNVLINGVFYVIGQGFIRLMQMLVVPLVFCSLICGATAIGDSKTLGKVGIKIIGFYILTTMMAVAVALGIGLLIRPGIGLDMSQVQQVETGIEGGQSVSFAETILNIIPKNPIGALANGEMLQVIVFALIVGIILAKLQDKTQLVTNFFQQGNDIMMEMTMMVMRLAPIGAFGAMAFTIGKYGVGTLVQLGQLIICFYITCILFVVLVLGSIARATGFSIFKFIRYIREELLIVLGTSSSESALPRMLDKMEKLGCRKSVVGLVIPTGYSFNLDGTSIYLTMAAVFIAQATNSHMDIFHQITLLVVLLLSSKGAAGVTGSGFIVLAATISAVGHLPVAGLALILGIDRFMSEARALTNLVGNGVATVVVAKWVKELDAKQLDDVLNNRVPADKSQELSS